MDAPRWWLFIGALNGLMAMIAFAYGWHTLQVSDTVLTEVFMVGVHVHMWHALALLAVSRLSQPPSHPVSLAGGAFTAGIVFFSSSLYAYAHTGDTVVPGAAPVGGILLMVGWAALAWAALGRARRRGGGEPA